MPKADLERLFPGLAPGGYRITSAESPAYNCAAWAAGETHRCWDALPEHGAYWPPGVPLVVSLGSLGYKICDTRVAEAGFEKLAIYMDEEGAPTHVARQLASGIWTSKLGALEDIEHSTLECLEGSKYGKVGRIMRRPIPSGK